jgi:lactobin A/cerein 7B family class IIb bacteriocin
MRELTMNEIEQVDGGLAPVLVVAVAVVGIGLVGMGVAAVFSCDFSVSLTEIKMSCTK